MRIKIHLYSALLSAHRFTRKRLPMVYLQKLPHDGWQRDLLSLSNSVHLTC